ncbi:MAG TPA: Stp1/IreP family PP2C-type Ser/Thr phosphatase [Solirubrobacteraceae bacterium]|nr:Stp1/IreP family PP2C-type Ser/Thr phosphatase [Solirubrobacteraceae bacterium]
MILRAVDFVQLSDTGRERRSNEDSAYAQAPLFAVADGMGGARGGEVASGIVVETLSGGMPDGVPPEEGLAELTREANHRIHQRATSDAERSGMGTTLTAAYVGADAVAFAHVGDSRAYRFRDGQLEQLTNDHSLVGELVRRGKLTAQQAEEHPQRSVITRALGPEASVQVDSFSFDAQPGDVFLLCSDGLTSMVPVESMEQILREADSLDQGARRLIDAANENGGRDNITVVLFRIEGVPEPGDTDADQPTVVGEKAPTADAVEAARAAAAPPSPRRTAPLPPRRDPDPDAPRKPRRGRRVASLLAVLTIVVLIGVGAWIGSRAVFFVGTNSNGIVTVYRGLPYDLPGGIHLYESYYTSGVPAAELPPDRRKGILDNRLRSKSDASDLVRKLELGQVSG